MVPVKNHYQSLSEGTSSIIMKKKEIKNLTASVRARLYNIAKQTGREFDAVVLQYFQERFLYRISISDFKQNSMKREQWQAFLRKNELDFTGDFGSIVEKIKLFIMPILDSSLEENKNYNWNFENWKWLGVGK